MTIKIGDIVRNDWTSDVNPIRYFIYEGIVGDKAIGTSILNGKIHKLAFYKQDLETGKFVVVGHCDYRSVIKNALEEARERNIVNGGDG